MIILLKIEATLFLVLLGAVLFLWMVGNGCRDDNRKFSDLLLYTSRIGRFFLVLLFFCMLVTAIWAF